MDKKQIKFPIARIYPGFPSSHWSLPTMYMTSIGIARSAERRSHMTRFSTNKLAFILECRFRYTETQTRKFPPTEKKKYTDETDAASYTQSLWHYALNDDRLFLIGTCIFPVLLRIPHDKFSSFICQNTKPQ